MLRAAADQRGSNASHRAKTSEKMPRCKGCCCRGSSDERRRSRTHRHLRESRIAQVRTEPARPSGTILLQNAEHVGVIVGPDAEGWIGREDFGARFEVGMGSGRGRVHDQRPGTAEAELIVLV